MRILSIFIFTFYVIIAFIVAATFYLVIPVSYISKSLSFSIVLIFFALMFTVTVNISGLGLWNWDKGYKITRSADQKFLRVSDILGKFLIVFTILLLLSFYFFG